MAAQAGDVTRIPERPERLAVIGAGKTALDTCVWLLEQDVPASSICWIKPREAWWLNRRFQQPLALLSESYRGTAIQLEAMTKATSIEDLFARLEEGFSFALILPSLPTCFVAR